LKTYKFGWQKQTKKVYMMEAEKRKKKPSSLSYVPEMGTILLASAREGSNRTETNDCHAMGNKQFNK
jgi:hypothetical protein